MASTIINRVIGGVAQNNLALNNSQFGRSISPVSTWNRIRVGVRVDMTKYGTGDLYGFPYLYIGLGSGLQNLIGDKTTTHFVGVRIGCSNWSTAADYYQTLLANSVVPYTKVGTTETIGGQIAAGIVFRSGALAGTADRSALWADITRGSPNFTINIFRRTNVALSDVSSATFLAQIAAASPVIVNHTAGTNQTIAVDEATNGTLNSIQFYWTNQIENMEFAEVAAIVIS